MKKILPFIILLFVLCLYKESAHAETSIPFTFTYEDGSTLSGTLSSSSDNCYFAIVRYTNLNRPMITCVDRTSHVDLPFSYDFGDTFYGSVNGYGLEIPNTNWDSDLSGSNLEAFNGYSDVYPYYGEGGTPILLSFYDPYHTYSIINSRQYVKFSLTSSSSALDASFYLYFPFKEGGYSICLGVFPSSSLSDYERNNGSIYFYSNGSWVKSYNNVFYSGFTYSSYSTLINANLYFYTSVPFYPNGIPSNPTGGFDESCYFDSCYLNYMFDYLDVYPNYPLRSPFLVQIDFYGYHYDFADISIQGTSSSDYISHAPSGYIFSTKDYLADPFDSLTVIVTPRLNNGNYGISSQFVVHGSSTAIHSSLNSLVNESDFVQRFLKRTFRSDPSDVDSPMVDIDVPVEYIQETPKQEVQYRPSSNVDVSTSIAYGDSTIYFSPMYNTYDSDGNEVVTPEQMTQYFTENSSDDHHTENTNWDFSTKINIDVGDVDLSSFDSSKQYVNDSFNSAVSYLDSNGGILEAFHFDGIAALVIGGVVALLLAFVVLIVLKIVGVIL